MAAYLADAELPPGTIYWTAEVRIEIKPAVYIWQLADNVARFDSVSHARSVIEDLNAFEKSTAEPGEVCRQYRVAVRVVPHEDDAGGRAEAMTVPREMVAEIGDYEITRHPASGEFEVWSAAARVAVFHSKERALQWASAWAAAASKVEG
ncbi:hypothetical protein NON00_02230 [Roseomonas sp. GC11]|uniref:hypothetical protein n=1 Tax=Roseomonas sp. GC11 TaxID=2950546 RepID=UPI00210CA308|nr:hypothetical protein [Roseomonas sp. GC11]MCQ4158744.1 hypothetical protein [Roseomonas sp. GC11]